MAPPSAAACRGADAYVTLGITRQATDGEVKQAYRRLALRSHPDKMPEDAKESATQRFQEIQAAYEALSPSKRKQYDAGGLGGFQHSKSELMVACEEGDIRRVRRLLEESVDIEFRDNSGRSALMFASKAACLEVMRLLIDRRANVEAGNCARHSCLMYAVGAGLQVESPASMKKAVDHLEAVKLLLERGAPVNSATSYGLTALMFAAVSGRVNMVDLLLSRRADVRSSSDIGLTALAMAADYGYADIAQRLLEADAEPNAPYGARKTVLMGAAAQAHTGVVRVLLEGRADVNWVSSDGFTALLYAVEHGLKEGLVCPIEGVSVQKPEAAVVTELLLQASADPHVEGPGGRSPLHAACGAGGPVAFMLVELLLKAGADADVTDKEGRTPSNVARGLRRDDLLALLAGDSEAVQRWRRRLSAGAGRSIFHGSHEDCCAAPVAWLARRLHATFIAPFIPPPNPEDG